MKSHENDQLGREKMHGFIRRTAFRGVCWLSLRGLGENLKFLEPQKRILGHFG